MEQFDFFCNRVLTKIAGVFGIGAILPHDLADSYNICIRVIVRDHHNVGEFIKKFMTDRQVGGDSRNPVSSKLTCHNTLRVLSGKQKAAFCLINVMQHGTMVQCGVDPFKIDWFGIVYKEISLADQQEALVCIPLGQLDHKIDAVFGTIQIGTDGDEIVSFFPAPIVGFRLKRGANAVVNDAAVTEQIGIGQAGVLCKTVFDPLAYKHKLRLGCKLTVIVPPQTNFKMIVSVLQGCAADTLTF